MTPLVLNTGIEQVRKHSTWFLVMGIALVIIGMIAIGYAFEMTIVSVLFLGWLLIIAGLVEAFHGLRPAMGRLFHQFAGRLAIRRRRRGDDHKSRAAAVTLTLLIAIILIVAGLFRLFVAFSTPLHHRGWVILNGAISILLGVMIWDRGRYPGSG